MVIGRFLKVAIKGMHDIDQFLSEGELVQIKGLST